MMARQGGTRSVRVLSVAVSVLGLLILLFSGGALAGTTHVKIEENETTHKYSFEEKTITVGVGETVVWKNLSDATHTVTSDSGSKLDSPQLAQNATYSETFSTAGDFAYHCDIHDYMHGVVHVTALPPTNTVDRTTGSSTDPLALAGLGGLGVAGILLITLRRRRSAV